MIEQSYHYYNVTDATHVDIASLRRDHFVYHAVEES